MVGSRGRGMGWWDQGVGGGGVQGWGWWVDG